MAHSYYEKAKANIEQGLDPVQSNPHAFSSPEWMDYNNACFTVLNRQINDMRMMQVVPTEKPVETYIIHAGTSTDRKIYTYANKEDFDEGLLDVVDRFRLETIYIYYASKPMTVKVSYE